MDFGTAYTAEQQRFRGEVRAWLEANIPGEMRMPVDREKISPEMNAFWRKMHRMLGEKGWLYPSFPKQYGGGGLSADEATVLEEEFKRAGVRDNNGSEYTANVLLVWATEEQKQKFLAPLLRGEKFEHMRMTEPQSGADLANIKNTAVRDGDGWVLSGQNVFISAYGDEDWLPGPFLTDPNAPRHRNLGYFIVPNPAPGVLVKEMDLLVGHGQKQVYMSNVRVPSDHLIGGDHQGWQVHATHLEIEHGGGGKAAPTDEAVEHLVEYARSVERDGRTVGSDGVLGQVTVDAFLEAHVDALMAKKTFWMFENHVPVQYEGNVADVHRRYSTLRNAIRVRDVMGLEALLGTQEPRARFGGYMEVNQRNSAGQHHDAGSSNIAKVILARRIGISRTKERAAPTASSVGGGRAPGG
jgi:alkylation response protein AidB-like acyl-CoA dehydrogenase